ncbi:sensor histidine kinase [Phenylobacterium sp. J426]|uniref:sensor histidine kinase n=1 Tax=Phenylobacterium sp. J426 TaxID=2898439 RepID=UPI002151A3D5|nr:HWE histidine kinase domain-containing protein [Phenylobacterium sp. J426]
MAAEAALWRAMFESSGLMAGAFELLEDDYRYLLANPKTAAFYGLAPEDLIGRTGRELGVGEPHFTTRMKTLRHCWRSGETLSREYAFDHAGRSGWFLGTFSPIPGEVPRISFVLVDVTERKLAQLEAQRQQARLELALSAGGLGFWEFDLARDVVTWDDRTRELFGVAPDAPMDYATYAARLRPEEAPEIRARFEAALKGEGGGRYSVVHRVEGRDGLTRWVRGHGQVLFDPTGAPTHVLGTLQDVTEEVQHRENQALMLAELNHRVKNNLATVQSMAAQTARRAESVPQFFADFEGRLLALARSHDVLTLNSWAGAELSTVLERELAAYSDRVRLRGPKVQLDAAGSVAMAMVAHELATNAAKYGALSSQDGVVEVVWTREGPRLALTWTERGGPPVTPPAALGFGSRLIAKLAAGDLRGSAEPAYEPEGLVVRLTAAVRA